MPSKAQTNDLAGRCYCGACSISAGPLVTASYCHCLDCRRWTGGPLAAFAAFAADTVRIQGPARQTSSAPDVRRQFCGECGSPLCGQFGYLPDQVYIPVGVLDDAAAIEPRMHSHFYASLPWLHVVDDLPRKAASARAVLNSHAKQNP